MQQIKTNKKIIFSIIVPIYNSDTYLAECIESLVHQKYEDYEIILVNDGSTDTSLEICKNYEKQYKNIIIVDKKNEGAVSAREAGLKIAKGEYVGFVDSDDWIDDNLLKNVYQIVKQYEPDIVSYNVILEFSNRQEKLSLNVQNGFFSKERLEREIYPIMLYDKYKNFYSFGIYPSLSNKFFKRELAYKNRCKDLRITMGDDAACVFASLLEAKSLYVMSEYYYHYRQNPFSTTNTYDSQRFQRYLYLIEYMKKVLDVNKYDLNNQLKAHKAFCVKHAILNESRAPISLRDRRNSLKKKMKEYKFDDAFDSLKGVKAGLASKFFIFLVRHRFYGGLLIMCEIFKKIHRF